MHRERKARERSDASRMRPSQDMEHWYCAQNRV